MTEEKTDEVFGYSCRVCGPLEAKTEEEVKAHLQSPKHKKLEVASVRKMLKYHKMQVKKLQMWLESKRWEH